MAKVWEQFEQDCLEHLKNNFSNCAKFISYGSSDSTSSDIKVIPNNKDSFFIETKHCPAQSGQFVLFPDDETQTFIYSDKNKTPLNESAKEIISCMNDDFSIFKNAGTKGIPINIDSDIFAQWIMDMYSKQKNVKFFMTNDYMIVPIEDFSQAFIISAVYRIKKSGSSSVGKSYIDSVVKTLSEEYSDKCNEIIIDGAKVFITSDDNLHKVIFKSKDKRYMFSQKENNLYEIRRLSDTANANVIFSVDINKEYIGMTSKEFEDFLFNNE